MHLHPWTLSPGSGSSQKVLKAGFTLESPGEDYKNANAWALTQKFYFH